MACGTPRKHPHDQHQSQFRSLRPDLQLRAAEKGSGGRQRRSRRRTLFQISHVHFRPWLAAVPVAVTRRTGIDKFR
jgi:hypothetical protein